MDRPERIARLIEEFDAQGWHRSGTQVDHDSTQWLTDLVSDAGAKVSAESFPLNRVDPQESYLEVNGERIDGLPLFDGTFTDDGGMHGRIGPLGSDAEIGVGVLSHHPEENQRFSQMRRDGLHKGMVAITLGDRPGLMATNAPAFRDPFGPPVLQVSSESHSLIEEFTRDGAEAHLVVSATRTKTETFNVVGRMNGSDVDLAPLVVMTPRSGWFHCAAERGGGLACWREIIRAIRDVGSQRDVLFVATGGHELGFSGIHAFLERHPNLATDAHAWLHFGHSVGGAVEPNPRFSVTDDGLETLTQDVLRFSNLATIAMAPRGTTLGGESQVVARLGGRVVAVLGGNAHFHLISDRWPEAVDVPAVASFADAFVDLAIQLSRSDA